MTLFYNFVMAGPVPAIHFPETVQDVFGLWKMDHRHKAGDDGGGSELK
jgi:hypothetical protein